ncbi:hypothetical protein D3C80_1848260 [compost metagenome]
MPSSSSSSIGIKKNECVFVMVTTVKRSIAGEKKKTKHTCRLSSHTLTIVISCSTQ